MSTSSAENVEFWILGLSILVATVLIIGMLSKGDWLLALLPLLWLLLVGLRLRHVLRRRMSRQHVSR